MEQTETSLFKYFHAIGFDRDLSIGRFGPGLQQLFCIFFSYDHYVQGLGGPEIAYGHLVQGHARGCFFGHVGLSLFDHLLKLFA